MSIKSKVPIKDTIWTEDVYMLPREGKRIVKFGPESSDIGSQDRRFIIVFIL